MNNLNFFYNIYKNIDVFVKHRYGHQLPPKTDKEVYQALELNDLMKLDVVTSTNNVIILYIKPGGRFDAINTVTKLMIKDQLKKDTKEMLVIVDMAFKRDNLPLIVKFASEIGEGADTWVQIRPLSIWFTNLLKNKQIPQHFIEKDWKTELEILDVTRASLPKSVEHTEPPIVWLGAKAGDIIEVRRPSSNVGQITTFREVI